jgi:hypothetical protein
MEQASTDSITQDGSLNLFKCLLVFGVVLQHSGFQRFSFPSQELVANLQHVFSFVVVGFFWAAGFLIKRERSWSCFFAKRLSRLMVPFLVVSLVNVAVFWVLVAITGREFGYAMSVKEVLRALGTLQGVGPQLYFLPYLFLLQVVAFPLDRWLPKQMYFVALSTGLLLVWLYLGADRNPMGPSVHNVVLYLSALFLGMACRPPAVALPGKLVLLLSVLILTACACVPAGVWHSVCCWAAPGALYAGLKQAGARVAWPGISNDIVSVFLWHTPILLPILSILCVQLWPEGYLALVVSITGAVALSIVFGRVVGDIRGWTGGGGNGATVFQ